MTDPVCSESAMVPPKEGAIFVSPLAALQVRDPLPKGVTGLPPTSAEPGKRIWPPSMAARDMHPGSAIASLATSGSWVRVKDGDHRGRALYRRHYSYRPYKDGRNPMQFIGPGEHIVLLTLECDALFIWRKFRDDSGQQGVNCACFRNEGPRLSSELILEAEGWAEARWPGERLYTYVNAKAIKSRNPGYCFKAAGWRGCGHTKGGLVILEKTIASLAPGEKGVSFAAPPLLGSPTLTGDLGNDKESRQRRLTA